MNRNKLLKLGHIFTLFIPIKKIIDSKVGKTELDKTKQELDSKIETELANKVDKINGKTLSTNDYTTAEKNKLAGIASGATKIQYVYEASTGRQRFNYSGNKASANYTHAEGYNTTASALYAHAEGNSAVASGQAAHAEGISTTASGSYSHAEGYSAEAKGSASHAEGLGTRATSSNQHAQGKYNIEDTANKYAHIVGNGVMVNAGGQIVPLRSNAHTIDWDGNGWFAGGLKVGGTGQDDDDAKEVATKDDINTVVSGIVVPTKVSELENDAGYAKSSDVIPIPSTAQVGQTIVIKSIDENGKPKEWESIDPWIITSSTEGSAKKFKLTIDDSGVLSAEELVE